MKIDRAGDEQMSRARRIPIMCCRTVLAAVAVTVVFGHAYAGNLYRYKNNAGVIVMDDSVPPQYVSGGYEVLSKSGQVLEVVKPQAEAPLIVTGSDGVAEQEAAEQEAAGNDGPTQEREDRFILSSYSSTKEIQQAKVRKLDQLEREIKLVESSLADKSKLRVRGQARAANYQRGGKPVPATVTDMLARLDEQELKANQLLVVRRQEYADTQTLYDRYVRRFSELTANAKAEQGGTVETTPAANTD